MRGGVRNIGGVDEGVQISCVRSSMGNKDKGNILMSAGLFGVSSVIRRGHGFSTYSRRHWRMRRVTETGYSAGPVDFNGILVVFPDFDDLARVVPASWRIPRLVLNADAVSNLQWGHFRGVR